MALGELSRNNCTRGESILPSGFKHCYSFKIHILTNHWPHHLTWMTDTLH